MRLMSGHGAFETADKPKKGAQDGERKLQRLSYDEFRLWVLEALRLVRTAACVWMEIERCCKAAGELETSRSCL
jgi:hypothetical protein